MKRFFAIFVSLALLGVSVGMTNVGAVDFGKLGSLVKDKAQTNDSNAAPAKSGSAPTLQQVRNRHNFIDRMRG